MPAEKAAGKGGGLFEYQRTAAKSVRRAFSAALPGTW